MASITALTTRIPPSAPALCSGSGRGRPWQAARAGSIGGRRRNPARGRPAGIIRAAQNSGSFSDAAGNAFGSAKKKAEEFNKEHDLTGKAAQFTRQASQSMKQTYDEVEDNVKRAAREANRKFDVGGKASAAFSSVKDTVEEADQKLGIRKKLQLLLSDLRRNWPTIRRSLGDFFRSPLGKITFFVGLYYALVSGWLLKIVSYVFLLTWLAVIFGIPRRFMMRAQEQAAQAQAGAAGSAGGAYAGGNPYGGNPYGSNPYAQAYQQQQQQRQQQQQQRSQNWPGGPEGAVVDVEWTTVDEDKPKKK